MVVADIQHIFGKLLSSSSSDRLGAIYEAFRQLYKLDPIIVPFLEVRLRWVDVSSICYGFEAKFLSIFL
jgi:hypothetical protein